MGTETQILSGSSKYNDFKGEVGVDEHMSNVIENSPLYECDDDKSIIGWRIGKYEYDAPIRVKILSVDNDKIDNGVLADDAVIYTREIDITVDEFIKNLGRIEVTMIRRNLDQNFGKEFTFDYED